ncbi:hypothetical protein KPL70_010469 [Citrus sinensis]|uniref:Uncharacterized protein n=2 Tax=Citrus TaxID=2706 RepID=A0ACB8MRM1_CITSI|nr:hypothetical protein CICLE_v10022362mg [Citrus x clementina]KAH9733056.1 hypothetical protein KPL70_010469 [Citrus sinensis]KAH9788288.1 hypothetical protein KPL71_010844 [Citrus sinensis]GAY41997.1 hypothetical protein CUMW_063560 [Citrus unshiu]
MALMASSNGYCYYNYKKKYNKRYNCSTVPRITLSQSQEPRDQTSRSGKKPEYLGVQKNQQALALCPATKNCISTAENISDLTHYAPPWNYNRGRKKPVSREVAMEELLQVIKSTKPDRFTPRLVEKKDDYVHVEYESPVLGLVDDVEFWFPPERDSIVEYRSASRLGNFDFDANRKRIKALRLALEKKGWASVDSF